MQQKQRNCFFYNARNTEGVLSLCPICYDLSVKITRGNGNDMLCKLCMPCEVTGEFEIFTQGSGPAPKILQPDEQPTLNFNEIKINELVLIPALGFNALSGHCVIPQYRTERRRGRRRRRPAS